MSLPVPICLHICSRCAGCRFLVTEAAAQQMSSEDAVALSLCVLSIFIFCRIGLTLTPIFHQRGRKVASSLLDFYRRCWKAESQSSLPIPLAQTSMHHQTTNLEETLGSTGDEETPFRATRGLYTGLRSLRDTEDRISDEMRMVLKHDIPSILRRL